VLIAAAIIVLLAGTLGARLVSRGGSSYSKRAPKGAVPAPTQFAVGALEVPCWSCPSAEEWPLRFRTDLDLLAPLGTGSGNAAEWFGPFAKVGGSRSQEGLDAAKRGIDGPEWVGTVLPPDDPLLLEAEPWIDQATMRFYPEIYELDGYRTRITNLLLALKLSRSWIARGLAADDTEVAMEDFRRAIRLGRLLRQEDTVVISDLVGLACIHLGARGVYERAQADGDLELALLASVVLGEVPAQRLGTKQRLTSTDLMQAIRVTDDGEIDFELQESLLDTVIDTARSAPDRRFRLEAILGLNTARSLGTSGQKLRAEKVLLELTSDDNPIVADAAQWSLDHEADTELLKEWAVPANQ
jgi:hypothetical protein